MSIITGVPTREPNAGEQAVTVTVRDDDVLFSVRRPFDIEPTVVCVPFDMLDVVFFQRLAKSIEARKLLNNSKPQ